MSEMFSPSSFYAFLRNDSRSGSGFKISFMVWRWLNTIAMLFIHFYYNFFVRLLMKMFCIQSSRMPWIHGMQHAISILDDIFLLGITRPSHTMCKWQEIDDGKKNISARTSAIFLSWVFGRRSECNTLRANEMEQSQMFNINVFKSTKHCTDSEIVSRVQLCAQTYEYGQSKDVIEPFSDATVLRCSFFLSIRSFIIQLSCIIIIYYALYARLLSAPDVRQFSFCNQCSTTKYITHPERSESRARSRAKCRECWTSEFTMKSIVFLCVTCSITLKSRTRSAFNRIYDDVFRCAGTDF